MFRCYRYQSNISTLAKGKVWGEPASKWAMHFRHYASILVTSKRAPCSFAVATCIVQYMGIITVRYGNQLQPFSTSGLPCRFGTLLTMNGSGEVSQFCQIDLWQNMLELVLDDTSNALTELQILMICFWFFVSNFQDRRYLVLLLRLGVQDCDVFIVRLNFLTVLSWSVYVAAISSA